MLTTGQAARLCGVKPDTVLKWINSGKVRAVRTGGGHWRISLSELCGFLHRPCQDLLPQRQESPVASRALHCWEYLSDQGAIRNGCKKCIVYRSQAYWCFRLAQVDAEIGHSKLFCQQPCDDCAYYRRVNALPTHVLVVTTDEHVVHGLAGKGRPDIVFCFARNGYEASAAISDFHPAFVVLDQDSVRAETASLLECLSCDPRAPGLKAILATHSRAARHGAALPGNVVSVIEKPFDLSQIVAVIESFPVEKLSPEESEARSAAANGGQNAIACVPEGAGLPR